MPSPVNIAIFGLNLELVNRIKEQVIHALPSHLSIRWVTIAEPTIDLLLVNDLFFHSNNIQRILSSNVKNYLRLVKSELYAGEILDDQLFYPFFHSDDFNFWMQEVFINETEKTGEIEKETSNFGFLPVEPVINKQNHQFKSLSSVEKVLDEVFIPRNGFIQLFDHQGFFALVDTRTERVWLKEENYPRKFNFEAGLGQTYTTNQFVQFFTQSRVALDLRIWLWQVLSQSDFKPAPILDEKCFKLDIWPHFSKSFERKNLLKLTTCFSLGAQIKDIENHLDISKETIEHFIQLCLFLRLGYFIDEDKVTFSPKKIEQDKDQLYNIKSFFGRLRKKLGL